MLFSMPDKGESSPSPLNYASKPTPNPRNHNEPYIPKGYKTTMLVIATILFALALCIFLLKAFPGWP